MRYKIESLEIALIASVILIILYGYFISFNLNEDFAFLFGFNLIPSLVLTTIIFLAFGRKRRKIWFLISLIVLQMAMISKSYIGFSRQIDSFYKTFNLLNEELLDSFSESETINKKKEFSSRNPNAKILYSIFSEMINESREINEKYQKQLNDSKWYQILEPNRVIKDKQFKESKMILKNVMEIMKIQNECIKKNMYKYRSKINESLLSDEIKQPLLMGFDKGSPEVYHLIDEIAELDSMIIFSITNILNILETHQDKWQVQSNQFEFLDVYYHNKFNNEILLIQELNSKQELINKKCMQKANKVFTGFQ